MTPTLDEGAKAPVDRSALVPTYTIEYRECDRQLSLEPMPDPFVNATVHVRGWRNALRVLLRRYSVTVVVGGDRETVERVSGLNPDYKGDPEGIEDAAHGTVHAYLDALLSELPEEAVEAAAAGVRHGMGLDSPPDDEDHDLAVAAIRAFLLSLRSSSRERTDEV